MHGASQVRLHARSSRFIPHSLHHLPLRFSSTLFIRNADAPRINNYSLVSEGDRHVIQRLIRFVLVAVAALACFGCDTLNYTQYKISDSAGAPERAAVVKIVQSAAADAGLVDRLDTSRVPNTLAYFSEPVEHFPTALGARTVGELVVIDLACFHPGAGEAKRYSLARAKLAASLGEQFGSRVTIAYKPQDQIPLEQSK